MDRAAGPALLLATVFVTACGDTTPPPANAARKSAIEPVKILQFYAAPSVVEAGEPANLCYGVDHATAVRLEPAVAEVAPSPIRCVPVTPRRDSRYTLVATGAGGSQATQSVLVRVVPASRKGAESAGGAAHGLITAFAASASTTAAHQPVTICYEVRNARSTVIEPAPGPVKANGKECLVVQPATTTTYTMTATGADGQRDRQQLTITVK